MDAVYVGWLSILPPMIAIILALITKEVLFSLIAGVLSGTLIYSIASGMNPIVGPVSTVFDVMIQKTDMNIIIFLFDFFRRLFQLLDSWNSYETYN